MICPQSLRPSHTAGLQGPLWASVKNLFPYRNDPQYSPTCHTKGPGYLYQALDHFHLWSFLLKDPQTKILM